MEPYTRVSRGSSDASRLGTRYQGSNPPTFTSIRGFDAWNNRADGWKNPNWRAQVSRHDSAGTSFSARKQEIVGNRQVYAYIDYQNNIANPEHTVWQYRGIVALTSLFANPATINTDAALRYATADFYKHAWEKIRLIQGGVVLGELRETLRMIRNPAMTLRRRIDEYTFIARQRAKGVRNVRSDPASRRRHVDRSIANSWLEFQFGARPLMGDIESGARALSESIHRFRGQYAVAVGKAETEVPLGSFTENQLCIPIPSGSNDIRYRLNSQDRGVAQVRVLGCVAVEVDNPYLFNQDLWGFSLSDFVPTVWELIPYSFLVDYFTNIGDVLSSWSFPQGRIKWGNRTVRTMRERKVLCFMESPHLTKSPPAKIHAWHGETASYTSRVKTVLRYPDSPQIPSIGFEIPGMKSLKWLNIAGLARARRLV